ncbi:2-thiouracil desulfurase family protein [Paenibacillus macquariensis]|uniref:Uncharacterized conserved protein YbbK, DUF523 family n=1 Tax=Paenibacillus macquariensis TaxID=948756 RepID=A0ABY1JJ91_9BACL|nr:DUF523 domain-containing protein [Paenibacillus macquariensis]MEC0089668.1 DUF523 domain-containing protein [Paenibacillus macquariensis]OAB30849.1 hypothetical protein PMSM_22200 [Paenibacillus macquariensis subsp. macquariensis]SIQ28364.1 Uncharacterized conserved protein YbbK, DUF523 family [Paenibacillus macquariensis]
MILVSSCLAGLPVRYNGTHRIDLRIQKLIEDNKAKMVCPELLGGFSTPREPAEIVGGDGEDVLNGQARVVDKSGQDVTDQYIKGAYDTLKQAQAVHAEIIILKEYSPSCGSSMIYNGTFEGKRIVGNGVTTALLIRNGLRVISEENLSDFLHDL